MVIQSYNPVPFDVLIEDLNRGVVRQGKPPIVATSQTQFERKFSKIKHDLPEAHK